MELIVVSEGSAIIAVDGEKYILNEGNGLFINTGVLHGGWIYESPTCRFHSIVFHPRLVGGSSNSIFWRKYLNPILNNKDIGVFCLNNKILIRRFYSKKGNIVLKADNKEVDDIKITDSDTFLIIGKVLNKKGI